MEKAIPLCVPDNCSWDEQSGQLHKHPTATRDALKVIDTARRRLRAIKGPVCVVTVAGPCRKGKSYILSKAFDQGEVFPLGHLLDPETMGIWMWVVPEKYTDRNGQEFTVVLLDSEGINAVSAENTDDHKIFTLSVLLGSVLIYNSSGVPSRTDLEGLDFISKLTQRIRLRARQGSLSEEDRPSFRKTFPYFVWLLRDVLLTLPPECDTIKEYFLKRVFNSKLDSNERAGKVAEDILDLFKGFDAFQLPPPSYDPDAVMKINDERVKEQLNPQFMAGVQRFATFLRSKLCPKTSFNDGEYVTGEALVTMLDIYVETLNTPGAVPNVQKSWEVFIHSKCSESVTAALKCYGESMIDLQKDLPCSNEGVCQHHRKSLDECLNVFRCETEGISALSTDKYLKELMAETDKLFKQWLEENRNLTKDSCVKLLHQLKKENLDRVLAQLASGKGTSLTFENVVQAYDSIESKYTKQARGAEDVCASIFAEFQPQLKSEMQNHVQYLKQLKDYDEKITEEREVRAKEEESRKILEEQIKLIDERRVQVEKEFKLMEEKKQADEQRLREQHQQELLAQKDQYRNLMEANMEQIRIERETAASQNNNTAEIISMMGEMLKSRDKEIFQLTQTMMDIASRPPTVIEKDSGSLLSIIPETIKTVGSFFFGKGLK